jgi:AcrR family transcriptional regulator
VAAKKKKASGEGEGIAAREGTAVRKEREERGARGVGGERGERGERGEQIVEAATGLFQRYGYRRTSMELLAAEARVAKPTLYAYFPSKEALFRAVCERVMGEILAGARAAAEAGTTTGERVEGVLAAKFTYLFGLVHQSPHGAELLSSQEALGADVVAQADRAYNRLLASVLEEGEVRGELAPDRGGVSRAGLVAVLLRCGHGANYGATTAAQHRRHLGELLRVVLAGVGAAAPRPPRQAPA